MPGKGELLEVVEGGEVEEVGAGDVCCDVGRFVVGSLGAMPWKTGEDHRFHNLRIIVSAIARSTLPISSCTAASS